MGTQVIGCEFCDETFLHRTDFIKHLLVHQKNKTAIPKKDKKPIVFAKSEHIEKTGFERAIVEKNSADILFNKREIGVLSNRISELEKILSAKSGKSVLSRDQQNKLYSLIRLLAKNMGEDEKKVKTLTKKLCFNGKELSLASMSKEDAHKYIDYILCQLIENNEAVSENDMMFYEKTNFFVSRMVKNKKCIICGQDGNVSIFNNRKFCLCDKHINEWKSSEKKDFISKYIFTDYFFADIKTGDNK